MYNDTAVNTTVDVFMCQCGGVNLETGACGVALVLEMGISGKKTS